MQSKRLALTVYILNMGGVSNFILELGKFLKSAGYEVSIVCTDKKGDWYDKIEQAGIKGRFFKSAFYELIPFGRILHASRIGRYMRKQAFDYIINNHSFYIHAAAGYFFDRSRIIHVIHNQLEQNVKRESDPMSDRIVGVSPRIEALSLQYLSDPMVTSILNGISLPEKIPEEYRNCSSRPYEILFVGRIDNSSKAVFLLPDIIQHLFDRGARVKITIVGDGPDLRKLKQIIRYRSLSEFFQFSGKVDPEVLGGFYHTHRILLMPSYYEGLPLSLLEAMAHGCVPVTSNLPQCTDTCIEQGKSGYLVDIGNVAEFAERIWTLLNDAKLLNEMSKQAMDRAKDQFSSSHTHQKYLELLQSFEGGNPERAKVPSMNRKYLSWKELVPFRLVIYIKRKILKSI